MSIDYYPGGSILPGRSFSSNNYRFGYQGSEKEDELSGLGNIYTTHFRQLDTRLLRWWSVDPKASEMPWQSSYLSMDGNPVMLNDPMGDCPICWGAVRWLAKRAIPLFIGGAAISVGTQFVGKYIMHDDAKKAAADIDLIDAAADGTINVITGGTGSLRT